MRTLKRKDLATNDTNVTNHLLRIRDIRVIRGHKRIPRWQKAGKGHCGLRPMLVNQSSVMSHQMARPCQVLNLL